ncbi:myosin heavy chain, fast skeletal muscle isoform X1 [Biomphalaria glabrata]|nr:myosin heavy chain, fast skeletal muscle isoform X1 [Biomphalaria glabrata]
MFSRSSRSTNMKSTLLTQVDLNENTNRLASNNDETLKVGKKNAASSSSVESLSSRMTPITSLVKDSNSNASITKDDALGFDKDLEEKIKRLEKDLAKSESDKLDLQDQIQMLEEKCKLYEIKWTLPDDQPAESLQETLQLKNQYIIKLEQDLHKAAEDSSKVQTKMKKQLRILRKQIQELRHEALIGKMERRLEVMQNSELDHPKITEGESSLANAEEGSTLSHSKVIVELSNQMTEQSEMIAKLERQIAEKDSQIQKLNEKINNSAKNDQRSENQMSRKSYITTSDRINGLTDSSAKKDSGTSSMNSRISFETYNRDRSTKSETISNGNILDQNRELYQTVSKPAVYNTNDAAQKVSKTRKLKLLDDRPPTSLSGSDSDWDANESPSEKRIQSAMSVSNTTKIDLSAKPASAGSSSDFQGKFRKKTILQRRAQERETNPQLTYTALAREPLPDSLPYLNPSKKTSFSKQSTASLDNDMLLLNLKS